jgi:outer membrane receptor for ferrienterochelin and colicin
MLNFRSIQLVFIILTLLMVNTASAKDYQNKFSESDIPLNTSNTMIKLDDSDQENIDVFAVLSASDSVSEDDEKHDRIEAMLELRQNYPNPFNLNTTIEYSLPDESDVYIAVYNIFGKRVKTIQDELVSPGTYKVSWDGRDDAGDFMASGMYFYLFSTDDNFIIRKMILLK